MVWRLWKEENAGLRGQGGSQDGGDLVGKDTYPGQNILLMVRLKVLCPKQGNFFDGDMYQEFIFKAQQTLSMVIIRISTSSSFRSTKARIVGTRDNEEI